MTPFLHLTEAVNFMIIYFLNKQQKILVRIWGALTIILLAAANS